MKEENQHSKPLFGKRKTIIDRIQSLDMKWRVEVWLIHYYFMGIEVYQTKKEIVKSNRKRNSPKGNQ